MLIGADVRTPVLAENDISVGSPVFTAQSAARGCATTASPPTRASSTLSATTTGSPRPPRAGTPGAGRARRRASRSRPASSTRASPRRCAGPTAGRSRARSARCSLTVHTMVTGEGLRSTAAAHSPAGARPRPETSRSSRRSSTRTTTWRCEYGADLFATPVGAGRWLSARGLLPAGDGPARPRPGRAPRGARGTAASGRGQQRRGGGRSPPRACRAQPGRGRGQRGDPSGAGGTPLRRHRGRA